jgi:DNA-binding MarR family transcriptional regulator
MSSECYCAVLRKAARKVTALYDVALAPTGINVAQYSLLRTIERKAPLSLTELGRLVELDRSTVGRNVRVLERLGLVRLAAGADQRESTVTLAGQGTATLREAAPLWDEAQRRIEATLGGPAAASELRGLLRSL